MTKEELSYYRSVEDYFALLRGTPFLFSPKDFGLLQRWWCEGVPLAAVLAGLAEVFARRRERDEDPVSSLAYCRHAVARHAKRLAAARRGEGAGTGEVDVAGRLATLARDVRQRAEAFAGEEGVARWLHTLAEAMATLPVDAAPAAVDEALADLEARTLDALFEALPEGMAERVRKRVEEELASLELPADALARTRQALSRRALRDELELPRLEL